MSHPFIKTEIPGKVRICRGIIISICYGILLEPDHNRKYTENRGHFDANIDQKLTKLHGESDIIHQHRGV
jgi:hypothetical protein